MELTCSFQTNVPELSAVWEHGIALFTQISDTDLQSLTSDAASFSVYLRLWLLLTADTAGAERLLEQMGRYLEKGMSDPTRHLSCLCYQYPQALLAYAVYTPYPKHIQEYISLAEQLLAMADASKGEWGAVEEAHRLGARLMMQRIYATCDMPFERVSLGREIARYHQLYYHARLHLYGEGQAEQPLINCLPAYYGFVSDDGQEAVCEYLVAHSFEVPRRDALFLYEALYHLEAYDSLLPTVLEGGLPLEFSAPSSLAGLLMLLTDLCGVNVALLGRGICCAQPHLPDHIGFRLSLPSDSGSILFDSGEAFDGFLF